MFLTSVVLTFATLAGASQIQPPAVAPGVVRVHSLIRQDGKQQIWEIDQARLAALPAWTPNAGSIPLIASRAVTAAQTWLSRHHPDVKGWTEIETATGRFGADGGDATAAPNGWFYAVRLEPANNEPIRASAALAEAGRAWVVVLFDGSVVEPKLGDAPGTNVFAAGPGTGVIPPRVIVSPPPRYTRDAVRARIQGRVTLQCVVNTNGICEDITVIRSLDSVHGLDEEAVNAAFQWRFAPGTRNGQPVKVRIVIEVDFNLRDDRK
jgi:TonB family protein